MQCGYYTYIDRTRKKSKELTDEQSSSLGRLNGLVSSLIEQRADADKGNVESMKSANETIDEMSRLRESLEREGVRVRFDSAEKKFVIS